MNIGTMTKETWERAVGPTAMKVRVLLRDTLTGDETWHESYASRDADASSEEYWWTEGNASCDCNRLMFLHRALGKEITEWGEDEPDPYPCGDGRVVIVRAEVDGVAQDWT